MTYVLWQTDGKGLQQRGRTVTNFPAGAPAGTGYIDHQTFSGATYTTCGRCLHVNGSLTNDGPYSVVAYVSTTRTLVKPPPNVEAGNSASLSSMNQAPEKLAATSINGATITATQIDTTTGTPIDFGAAGVQRNDRVILVNTALGNDGVWFVSADPTTVGVLAVRPLNGGSGLAAGAETAGTIQVRVGQHAVIVTNEASPSFSGLFSSGTVHATKGSGTISDYRYSEVTSTNAGATEIFSLIGINPIIIDQTLGGSSAWVSQDEIVLDANVASTGVKIRPTNYTGGVSSFQLGNQPGSDVASAASGSAHFNIYHFAENTTTFPYKQLATNMVGKMFGSFLSTVPTGAQWWQDFTIGASIINGTFWAPAFGSTTGGDIDTAIQYGTTPWNVFGPNVSASDLSITDSSEDSYMPFLGPVTIEGLKISDSTYTPVFELYGPTITTIRNPRADYTGAELFYCNTGWAGEGYVTYTWNPTFVERDVTGVAVGAPIQGLKIRIWDMPSTGGSTELPSSPYTSDANGQLNSGAGVDLKRWYSHLTAQENVSYTQRIQIEGQNYRSQDYVITMRAKLDYDHPVDVQQTDFEGELNVG